jgi:hypothetical protein
VNTYIVGQVVFLRARLSDPSTGDASDPATQDPIDDPTIAVTVYKPDGSTVNTSLAHASTGTYTAAVTVDQNGQWEYVSLSTGAAAGAGRERFYVSPIP